MPQETSPAHDHRPLPHALISVSLALGVMAICIGLLLYARGLKALGVFLVVGAPVGWALTSGQIAWSRRRLTRAPLPACRGESRQSASAQAATPGNAGGSFRLAGGMNVPAATGRVSATLPLAVLELTGTTLDLRIRPRWFRRLVGGQILTLSPNSGAVIFPVHQLIGVGIGIRPSGQATWYFRTSAPEHLLSALDMAGFEISAMPGKWGR